MSAERPPQKPYFLRACHAWIGDCGMTPQIIVDTEAPAVEVPRGYAREGRLVLNVSMAATEGLVLGNEAIEFRARFGSAVHQVRVPVSAVLGIFARESGEGLAFAGGESQPEQRGPEPGSGGGRPPLKVVKSAAPTGSRPAAGRGTMPLFGPGAERPRFIHGTGAMEEETAVILRNDWTRAEVGALYRAPLNDLLFRAHSIHRAVFDANAVQISMLLSVKTGGCPEDCKYCPQSVRYRTDVDNEAPLAPDTVLERARRARAAGATRFCMGAAWRRPRDRDLEPLLPLIGEIRELGMETCLTLGMLTREQAERLARAGLDYYNHNLDTSPEYYERIISTRTYADRLETLAHVREAGIRVCCGGIVGLGESEDDRIGLLHGLATLPEHPESVPINELVQVPGTPLDGTPRVDPLEFVRTVATARVLMPRAHVRLAAGRTGMSDELQALCFFAGANSIFYGETLLTTPNPEAEEDRALFARLGLRAETSGESAVG